MPLFNPVTLITGASSGIGAALARVFAQHGHEIAIVARREAKLSALADSIAQAGHKRPHVIAVDLGRSDSPARLAHELLVRGLEPGTIVNNAGFGLLGAATELDRGEQLAMIDINMRALTDLSLRWIDSIGRHHGGILNVASVAGFLPGPRMAVYYATKAYVVSFTEALHQELKSQGIRVTVLCPGPVKTEFQARAGIGDKRLPRLLTRSVDQVANQGYRGFMAGQCFVVPGLPNKLVAAVPRFLPRRVLATLVNARQRREAQPSAPQWPRRPAKRT
jgi:short-subunit dehydrogenase